ncbi:hypothetical protein BDP27DRAFT_1483596 [Rhodocollybia butyracea]|uniref:Uncharacterized protein n=1 Tax=Rhodocollybia butyracea TaxID=206335 RepID=A0A9P5PGH1_9AGAR|nr:hypothetical protein BDP27DRAFT_1483596 [Rhodocollybia butyracea]
MYKFTDRYCIKLKSKYSLHLFKLKRSTSTFQLHGNAKASCRQSLDLTASRMHAHVPPKAVGTQAGPRDTNSLYHNRWISVLLRNSSTAGNLGAGWNIEDRLFEGLQRRISLWHPRRDNSPDLALESNIHTLQHTHGLIHFYAKFPLISGVKYNGFGKMISAAFSSNHQLYGIHISELLTQKPLVFAAGIFGAKAMLNVQDTSEMLRRQWAVLSVDPAALQRTFCVDWRTPEQLSKILASTIALLATYPSGESLVFPNASKRQRGVIWIQEAARGIPIAVVLSLQVFLFDLEYMCKYLRILKPVALEIHHVHLRYCASRELQEGYNPNLLETGKKQMDADSESSNGKKDILQTATLASFRLCVAVPCFRTTRGIRLTYHY